MYGDDDDDDDDDNGDDENDKTNNGLTGMIIKCVEISWNLREILRTC